MKSLQLLPGIFLVAVLSIGGCSTKSDDSSSTGGKLSFLLEFDNTVQTFLPCAVSGGEIDCSGQRQVIPTLSYFRPYWNTSSTFIDQLEKLPSGCQAGTLSDNTRTVVDNVDTTGCRFAFRLYRESDVSSPWREWSEPMRTDPSTPLSGALAYLTNYNFKVVNIDNGGNCNQSILHRVSSSASATSSANTITMGTGQLAFSGLFSLAAAPETLNTTTAPKNQDFVFKFQPALDTAPLISAGITDDDIESYLTPHLGDFLVLYAEDSYGHKAFCKAADAVTGAITLPANILKNFNGNTGFRIIRYKISRTALGDADFRILMKVGMYRDGTDAWGAQGGTVTVWMQ